MKIGFVSSYFYERERMNYAAYPLVYNIVEKLAKSEECFVIANGWPKRPHMETINNIKVIRCPSVPYDYLNMRFMSIGLFALKNVLAEKPDILNSQTVDAAVLYRELNMLNKKISKVLSLKSLTKGWLMKVPYPKSIKTYFEYSLHDKWEKLCINNSDYIIVPSKYFKKEVVELCNVSEEIIQVIPNGIDTNLFKAHPKNNKELTLLFAGGESIRKGADIVIDSFIELKKEFENLKLIVLGSEKLERFENVLLKNNIKLGKDILCFSRVSHIEMAHYLNQADIVVHPSYHETFGTILIEAMACEKPVVTTKNTAIPEVIENCGVLVETGNTEDFTEAIKNLLTDEKKRGTIGKKSRKRVLKEFKVERVIEDYHKLFNRIA